MNHCCTARCDMAAPIIDTHSHIYLPEFDADRDEVVARAVDAGVAAILLPDIDPTTTGRLMRCVEAYPELCRPMAGLHPTSVDEGYETALAAVERNLDSGRDYVAVGEIGLDLYWGSTYRTQQMAALDAQLDMAARHGLPVVIHCRNAFDELFEVLANHGGNSSLRGVAHSFTGTLQQAEWLMGHTGFYFGVNGIVTFKKSDLPATLRHIPIGRVVAETDSPYLAPVPHRGQRNESAFVADVVKKVADIYGLDYDTAAAALTENARALFEL